MTLPMRHDDTLTAAVKDLAARGGFDLVGIAPPGRTPAAETLTDWLGRRWHGDMAYMAANVEKRQSPAQLVPGAKSVICLAVSYVPAADRPDDAVGVARYARGRDYHKVLKSRCHRLMDRIGEIAPDFAGRAFVDSAPVQERALARRAGLGVIGLNGCLITPEFGSYVLLCEIVCTLALAVDSPAAGDCGRCGRCLEACPTGALGADALVDARKCISYLTIEHRGALDASLWPRMGSWIFGCDRCQEVCPHNGDLPPGDDEFRPRGQLVGRADLADILNWRRDDWDLATRGSPMRRATFEMFLRNAIVAVGNSGAPAETDARTLRESIEAVARRHRDLAPLCQWALGRLVAAGPPEQ